MQIKYHILLPSVYYGILHFGCILKYNHVVLKKRKRDVSLQVVLWLFVVTVFYSI